MTAPRDPDRLIQAFLEDGTDALPDWAFDEVRHDIHRTRQRVAIGPWREPVMSSLARYGVIAAAVVLLVGAGAVLLRPAPAGVAASASVAQRRSPTPSPTEAAAASPDTPARTPAARPGPDSRRRAGQPWRSDLTIPSGGSGWIRMGQPVEGRPDAGRRLGSFAHGLARRDHRDVRRSLHRPHLQEPVPKGWRPSSRRCQPARGHSGPAADVTVSGYSGQFVDTTVTADIATCLGGEEGFWLWASPDDRRYVQGTDEANRIYAFDVDGRAFHLRRPPPGEHDRRRQGGDHGDARNHLDHSRALGLAVALSPSFSARCRRAPRAKQRAVEGAWQTTRPV